ncbi:MAG: hypothetical protein ACOCXJ_04815, partial [Planctomycetota bacterium]
MTAIADESLDHLAHEELEQLVRDMRRPCLVQDELLREKLDADLRSTRHLVATTGGIRLDEEHPVHWQVRYQSMGIPME